MKDKKTISRYKYEMLRANQIPKKKEGRIINEPKPVNDAIRVKVSVAPGKMGPQGWGK